jgi:guanylate kinase
MTDAAQQQRSPLLVLISGPSGAGKDAVIARLRGLGRPFHFVVTATTRAPRAGEKHGVDYYFLAQDEFDSLVAEGAFLEHATVYGRSYGVPRTEVANALVRGDDIVMRVDVQGARTLRDIVPEAIFVFVAPPSGEDVRRRLVGRRTESDEDLARRLALFDGEMEQIGLFDYRVVNEDGRLDEAVAAIEAIVTAEHARVRPRVVRLD